MQHSFHHYNFFRAYLDDVEVLNIDPGNSFWELGGLDSIGDIDNPWAAGEKMAPFDKKVNCLYI